MEKRDKIFEGNEKMVFATDDPEKVIFHFKDIVTAYNSIKRAQLPTKGIVNNAVSSLIFDYLKQNGVHTHYIEKIGPREQLCHKILIVPLQVVVHNFVAGSLATRLGIEEGTKPCTVIYDLRYNNEELGDPLINDTQAVALGIVSFEDLEYVYETARRINALLTDLFTKAGLKLVDFKLEFGRDWTGHLIVSDEISPDTCRIWDAETDEKLDKDRFRHDLGYIVASYEKVYERLQASINA